MQSRSDMIHKQSKKIFLFALILNTLLMYDEYFWKSITYHNTLYVPSMFLFLMTQSRRFIRKKFMNLIKNFWHFMCMINHAKFLFWEIGSTTYYLAELIIFSSLFLFQNPQKHFMFLLRKEFSMINC